MARWLACNPAFVLWFLVSGLVCGALVVLLLAMQVGGGGASIARAQGTTVSGAACGSVAIAGAECVSRPIILTARQREILAKKTALAQEFRRVLAGKLPMAAFQHAARQLARQFGWPAPQFSVSPFSCTDTCPPTSASLNVVQQPQTTNYYCGPATVAEILKEKGITHSQGYLAGSSFLNTSSVTGTSWNPHVVPNTLNTILNTTFHVPLSGSGTGASTPITTSIFESDLTADISTGWPLAGNVYEPKNGLHLPGHRSNQDIWHWIAIKGYINSGANTTYADSVYGATSVGWYQSVTSPYYTISSSDMATLANNMGLVW
jgi:hypothetical protein